MDNQNQTISMDYLKEGIEDLTPETCREKCQEQSVHIQEGEDKNCEFFHWQENHEEDPEKKCSLQTTCPPRSTCGPIAKHCTSGQLGCSDDCQAISPCSLTKAAWNHDKFHVVCTDPRGYDINIYMDDVKDKKIANGTVCQTVRKCAAWNETSVEKGYSRKLAVFCDGTTVVEVEGEDKGTWTEMPSTGDIELSKAMITDTPGTITEQECSATCENFELTTYLGHWWAMFSMLPTIVSCCVITIFTRPLTVSMMSRESRHGGIRTERNLKRRLTLHVIRKERSYPIKTT